MTRQFVMIDADDTLWENNIYFERAFDEFVEYLAHSTMTALEVRAVLDEIELANARIHGYGSKNFGRNLHACYERLVERKIDPDDAASVMGFAERIIEQPLELIEGVVETLEYLSQRHELILFTKGQEEEQRLKIDRSGLAAYFHHTAIVREKDAQSYRAMIETRGMDTERAWMVGNSPKSDVLPALEAGLGAVYVPHERTWHLERMEVPEHTRLKIVRQFRELATIF